MSKNKQDPISTDDGWISTLTRPAIMAQSKKSCKRFSPLSRKSAPRRILVKRSKSVSRLTQNSPPPPQLKTNTKQSSLLSYFGGNCKESAEVKENLFEYDDKSTVDESLHNDIINSSDESTSDFSGHSPTLSSGRLNNDSTCADSNDQTKSVGNEECYKQQDFSLENTSRQTQNFRRTDRLNPQLLQEMFDVSQDFSQDSRGIVDDNPIHASTHSMDSDLMVEKKNTAHYFSEHSSNQMPKKQEYPTCKSKSSETTSNSLVELPSNILPKNIKKHSFPSIDSSKSLDLSQDINFSDYPTTGGAKCSFLKDKYLEDSLTFSPSKEHTQDISFSPLPSLAKSSNTILDDMNIGDVKFKKQKDFYKYQMGTLSFSESNDINFDN